MFWIISKILPFTSPKGGLSCLIPIGGLSTILGFWVSFSWSDGNEPVPKPTMISDSHLCTGLLYEPFAGLMSFSILKPARAESLSRGQVFGVDPNDATAESKTWFTKRQNFVTFMGPLAKRIS